MDQINKIHNVVGTPPAELLGKMKKRSAHMDFNFPPTKGTGIASLIPHARSDAIELIEKLLAYNPDDRCVKAFERFSLRYLHSLRQKILSNLPSFQIGLFFLSFLSPGYSMTLLPFVAAGYPRGRGSGIPISASFATTKSA